MLAFQQGPGVNAHREPGIDDDDVADQGPSDGSFNYTGQDKPFMKALVETKGLIATFSGHDHGDDWYASSFSVLFFLLPSTFYLTSSRCFKWNSTLPQMDIKGDGVVLCFDRHSGYGGYGTWTRGSRQILLNERTMRSSTDTWVRLEQGNVSGAVTLNSTYGQDYYPAVLDTHT